MEIDRSNFFWMLPCMLQEAQKARFVAIDIEMSGISAHNHTSHNNSIQDSYTKIKEAAEKYQVLQVGFTFCHYNENRSEYMIRTFNCHVSPLFPRDSLSDRLTRHLDRNFCVSARSYNFLRQNQFNLTYALDNGIYYLSSEELKHARRYCLSGDKDHEHVDPLKLDEESQRFYKYAERKMAGFIAGDATPGVEFIMENPYGGKLNGLQLRLIYQIIREHYPAYTAKRIPAGAMTGCVSISLLEEAARLKDEARQHSEMNDANKLSGLQILLEALSGGPFMERINREWFCHSNRPPIGLESWSKFNRTFGFEQCEASLQKSRPILVGHNLLQDLAFLFQTFFHPLPQKVDDFINKIHTLFPRIIDTKFMHTRDRHMMEVNNTLHDLHYHYAQNQFPAFRCDPRFSNGQVCAHNAGFDSYMTAVLCLKQAHASFSAQKHLNVIDKKCYVPPQPPDQDEKESTGYSNSSETSWSDASAISLLDREEAGMSGALQNWNVLIADESASRQISIATKSTKSNSPQSNEHSSSRFCHREATSMPGETYSEKELHMIPLWTNAFWQTYGNKSSITGAGHISFS
ncbi:CAF1-domain-containing protein [Rostrohypoxylon terebratum]|nr:CAF1-domain-containing protein [Rostrohypoxylon terebratum]